MAYVTPYWTLDVLVIFISILVAAYLYTTRNFNYWKKKGVHEVPPTPFLGNFGDCCLFRKCFAENLKSIYEEGKGLPYVGYYLFDKPALVLRDPEIIKAVLVRDFNYLSDRHATPTDADPLGTSNLFLIKNPVWKSLRHKLTPFFSSGKLKAMFPLFTAVGDDLVDHLENLNLEGDGEVIELKEIAAKYATDVIGSCAFGVKVNSLNNPNAEFRKNGKKIFDLTYMRGFELLTIFFIPSIAKLLGSMAFSTSVGKFLRQVFWDIFNERTKSGSRREDLIDLLIELRNSQKNNEDPHAFGKVFGEQFAKNLILEFDGDNLVAQAGVFFAAGFETSSTTISFTLHELSMHPDIQDELRDEINTALEENDGKLSYDMVQKLPYLEKVVSETFRKYPAVPFLDRMATHDYKIEKTGLVIEKGTPVYVPLLGLHSDSEYFTDPENYDPERFSEENKQKCQPYIYMPFGEGPHSCIGLRFGKIQVKIAIIRIISNYELSPCEKTLIPVRLNPKALFMAPNGGLYHRLRKVKTTVG